MNNAKLILFFLPPPFETFFNFFTAEKGPFCSRFVPLSLRRQGYLHLYHGFHGLTRIFVSRKD